MYNIYIYIYIDIYIYIYIHIYLNIYLYPNNHNHNKHDWKVSLSFLNYLTLTGACVIILVHMATTTTSVAFLDNLLTVFEDERLWFNQFLRAMKQVFLMLVAVMLWFISC